LQTARPKDFPVHYTHQSKNTKDEFRREVTHRQHFAGRKSGLGDVRCVWGAEGQETGMRRRRQEEGGRGVSKGVGDSPL